MNKHAVTKTSPTIPGLLLNGNNSQKTSKMKEDDYYQLNSQASKKSVTTPKSKKPSNKGFLVNLPHNWEMTDYDDDHFELLSFTRR